MADFILILVLIGAVALALRKMVRDRKRGACSGCASGCAQCPHAMRCGVSEEEQTEEKE